MGPDNIAPNIKLSGIGCAYSKMAEAEFEVYYDGELSITIFGHFGDKNIILKKTDADKLLAALLEVRK